MSNEEIIEKLCILEVAILNPHHRIGEYVDKRFAQVVIEAADALEAADKQIVKLIEAVANRDRLAYDLNKYIGKLEAQMPKEGEWIDIDGTMFAECSVCGKRHYGCTTPFCDMCGAKMK